MRKPTFTAQLTEDEKEVCRQAAASINFKIGRGSHPDWGSIEQLLKYIASGDVILVRHYYHDPNHLRGAVDELRKLAEDVKHTGARQMIEKLIAAIDEAARRM
jgi:hypothetical protein